MGPKVKAALKTNLLDAQGPDLLRDRLVVLK